MKTCPSCGELLGTYATSCFKCGYSFSSGSKAYGTKSISEVTPKKGVLTVYCYTGEELVAEGSSIIIKKYGKQTMIPISSIQEFQVEEPGSIKRGSIRIRTSSGNTGFFMVGGMAAGVGGEIRLVFSQGELPAVRKIQTYIAQYGTSAPTPAPAPAPAAAPASAAFDPTDELRKYKSLLDDGIITQAEFDAKKKQILGI